MLGNSLSVDAQIRTAGAEFLLERGKAHHEKLIDIGRDDGEEFDTLEEFIAPVARFFEHALLEFEQTDFAVDV